MPQIKSSITGATTLAASDTSETFKCLGGVMHVYLSGTPDTNTLTLYACRTETGTFEPYYVDDVSGTSALQAFTATQVTASTVYHRVYLEHGMFFKFITNGTGSPTWEVDVNGNRVHLCNEE